MRSRSERVEPRPAWRDRRAYDEYELSHWDRDTVLGRDEAGEVVGDLAAGLPGFGIRAYFARWPELFSDYDHLVLARERRPGGRVIGMCGARWLRPGPQPSYYLATVFVAAAHHGTPLVSRLTMWGMQRAMAAAGAPALVSAKSSHPGVLRIFRALEPAMGGVRVYPDPYAPRQDLRLAKWAREIAAELCPGAAFDEESGVISGGQARTAPDLFPGRPESRDPALNRWFGERVGADDQILCLLHVPPEARSSFAAVVGAVADA